MRRIQTSLIWCCLSIMLLLTAIAVAQDKKMSEQEMAAMQEYMKIAAPGEHHKNLDYFVGNWNTVTRTWMAGPESTPTETKGTSAVKWILDGRFIMEEHKGQMMGMPYEGMGLTGYDNYRNMYTSLWTSNMGTNMIAMTGALDPSGKVFTYYGEMDEPMLKITGRTIKYIATIKSPDQYVFEVIDLHATDNYKVFEITYNRVK
jgi:hypothetical protein